MGMSATPSQGEDKTTPPESKARCSSPSSSESKQQPCPQSWFASLLCFFFAAILGRIVYIFLTQSKQLLFP
jgi:hypothetical protein